LPYQSCSTSSTTAQLVMGDALAGLFNDVIKPEDFAIYTQEAH
jgi:D-arabinose 5-phosphate isomerase GutQ